MAELRTYATTLNNSTVSLSATGGDPHPVTGVVTPGEYWINGEHIANPTGVTPIFLDLVGNGNTFTFAGTTIKLDTRKLDGFGSALGHESSVRVVRLAGTNNTINDLTLIGEHLALDTDPDARRWAGTATQYVRVEGDGNTVDGAHVLSRGSLLYGVSDAFGKGGREDPQGLPADEGGWPLRNGAKANNFLVRNATNATINDVHLDVRAFGHGFYVQQASDVTLSNSTVTGELVPATNVINHELYQEYGLTTFGKEIPDDIFISAGEDGVRSYGNIDGIPVTGLKVENVVVRNMRQGFATSVVATDPDTGIAAELINVEAYGNEVGFTPGTNDIITNGKGDIENGPLIQFQYDNIRDVTVDLELVGDAPVGQDYAVAYLNGQRLDITIESDLDLGDLPQDSFIRLAQTYFNNWRDNEHPTGPEDNDPGDFIDSTITNNTNQMLVLGQLATNNTISSQAPIVPNGKDTPYDGISFVPEGLHVTLTHANGLGNNGSSEDGTFDDNSTIVEDGATLEVAPLVQIKDERIYITGDGIDGKGAIYTDGSNDNLTRIVNSVGSDELIILKGDASIGVGDADGMLLVSRLAGTGNLTKLGAGTISVEKFSSFDGDFIVAEGHVLGRRGTFKNDVEVQNGTSIGAIVGYMLESYDGQLHLDGTLDMNTRTDDNIIDGVIGSLTGGINGVVTSSNPFAGAGGTLEIAGATDDGQYLGTFEGAVNIVKSGSNTQAFDGTLTHTGTTSITGGTLLINGTHTGGDAYTVSGSGTLGGDGDIQSSVVVNAGGTLSPGNSPGILTIDNLELNTGAVLDLEIGGNLGGSGYDRINADTATLGGDLNISLLDLGDGLFEPGAGDSFLTLFATTSLTGSFDNVASGERLDTEGGEGSFVVTYGGGLNYILLSSFESSASLAGDYNGDGFVSQADLDLVLLNWGTTSTPGGFDESAIPGGGPFDGLMSQNELDGVLLNWGDGAVPNLNAIPEPATAGLLGLTLLTFIRRHRVSG